MEGMEDKYLDLKRLSNYSSLSVRTLRNLLSSIPHYKLRGKILVKKSDFDEYMERFRSVSDLDKMVNEVMADLSKN